jgi:hypothetical protein
MPKSDIAPARRRPEKQNILNLAQTLGIAGKIPVTGFRTSVPELWCPPTCPLAPSLQEGLPTHVIEAMATVFPASPPIRGT